MVLLPEILRGVELACGLGYAAVKLNAVLLRGLNDDQLPRWFDYLRERDVAVRFIELMRTGDNADYFARHHRRADAFEAQLAEHGWRLNQSPATYEQVHMAMLAGLLGNVGCKSDDEDWYLGARGIKFWRHPGAHLSKKPGRWLVAAELVDTTRLFGRGLAAIEPQWIERIAGHLLKKQLLEPHWEKKAAEVVALERATLYGIVIYHQRKVNFGRVDPKTAREIFIREALVNGEWDSRLPFIAHNRKMIAQVEELEHKSRRQDVLVDEELIHAFYDQQVGAEVVSGATFERWYREASRDHPKLLMLSREELMRHEAAGVTTSAFPRTVRLGGVDCAASYLHQPGDPKDGVTVTVPIYALNQVSEERCEWLVPGMLEAKVMALVKSLHQRPRSRLVPLPEFVAEFCATAPFAQGALDACPPGAGTTRRPGPVGGQPGVGKNAGTKRPGGLETISPEDEALPGKTGRLPVALVKIPHGFNYLCQSLPIPGRLPEKA